MSTGIEAKRMIEAPSEAVLKPTEVLKVFIQNGGAGTQYLMAGTSILYEVIMHYGNCIPVYSPHDVLIAYTGDI